jgi:hypothetical protein
VRPNVAHHVHVMHDVPLILQPHYVRVYSFRPYHLQGKLPPSLTGVEYVREVHDSSHANVLLSQSTQYRNPVGVFRVHSKLERSVLGVPDGSTLRASTLLISRVNR